MFQIHSRKGSASYLGAVLISKNTALPHIYMQFHGVSLIFVQFSSQLRFGLNLYSKDFFLKRFWLQDFTLKDISVLPTLTSSANKTMILSCRIWGLEGKMLTCHNFFFISTLSSYTLRVKLSCSLYLLWSFSNAFSFYLKKIIIKIPFKE